MRVLFFFFSIALFFPSLGSKITCNSLYTLGKENLSNNPFIPLSVFVESEKNLYAVRAWAMKRAQKSVGPGIGIMYREAHNSALKVRNSLKIEPKDIFVFDKPSGNIIADFAQVVQTIKKKKYKYIQNALILLPDKGVYTILPLAEFDPINQTYAPIVIKGHQDLKKSDILTAAISAKALGKYMENTSETATVSLRPIVPKRRRSDITESKHLIKVQNYNTNIEEIYENFIAEYARFTNLYKKARLSFFQKYPEASREDFIEKAINPLLEPSSKSLKRMSYAPSKKQLQALKAKGIKSKEEMAQVDLNSLEFIKLAFDLNIAPYRLKHFILRSRATVANQIILASKIPDPGENLDYVIQLDIEGVLKEGIKSGAYYFGLIFEPVKKSFKLEKYEPKKPKNQQDKMFIGGFSELSQENVDSAWAELLTTLKTDPRTQSGKYKIAVYSPYEGVKLNQALDIRKESPQKFTQEEMNSVITIRGEKYPLYKEINTYSPKPGLLGSKAHYAPRGYLIRRVEFFEKYPHLTPEDIFNYQEKLFDMLPYYRHDIINPGKNNSIKTILPYAQMDLPEKIKRVKYAVGDNGLNCIAWYYHYLATGDKDYLERIRLYLELDIDANSVVWNLLRRLSKKEVLPENKWSEKTIAQLESALPFFIKKVQINNLLEKKNAIQQVLKKKLNELSDGEIQEFAEILDRSSYRQKRQVILRDKRYSALRKRALLAYEKHAFESQRKESLLNFFQKINPKANSDLMGSETQDALYALVNLPSSQLSPIHLNKILFMEQIKPELQSFIESEGISPMKEGDFDLAHAQEIMKSTSLKEKLKTLRKIHYRLLRYNELDDFREYGFTQEYEKYESLNMKALWEGFLIEYLFNTGF